MTPQQEFEATLDFMSCVLTIALLCVMLSFPGYCFYLGLRTILGF